ncbi:MAG: flavoprotein [Candidatus Cloacimonadota bacterium]|nr:MAG: flavoprotein [Candidatus Cloacimonadota bacterium]
MLVYFNPQIYETPTNSKGKYMYTIISGTNRNNSKSLMVAKTIEKMYQEQNVEVNVIDLRDLPQSLFLPESYDKKPDEFQPFIDKVVNAKGLIIVAAEYNGSAPGILKYFIDMLPYPDAFENVGVSFVGLAAGKWAGIRAVEHMQQVFGYRDASIHPKRVFIPNSYGVLSSEDSFKTSDEFKRLNEQTKSFINFCDRLID